MKSGFAKIPVQNSFCAKCSERIKTELLEINDIKNVYLYADDSLVVFNFIRANELSMALNTLTALGYPPTGDKISTKNSIRPFCICTGSIQNDASFYKTQVDIFPSRKETRQYLDEAS